MVLHFDSPGLASGWPAAIGSHISCAQLGVKRTSSSVKSKLSPLTSERPRLSAFELPLFGSNRYRTFAKPPLGKFPSMGSIPERSPLSITSNSTLQPRGVRTAHNERNVCSSGSGRDDVAMMMLTEAIWASLEILFDTQRVKAHSHTSVVNGVLQPFGAKV